jgi:hypothetical protein
MCHLCKKWRTIALKEFKKGIDLGAAGMLWDECQWSGGAKYCWDKTHGHHVLAFIYKGSCELDREFRGLTAKLNPEYLFAGEAIYDLKYLNYKVSYFRIDPFGYIPGPRYIDSDKDMMSAITGFDDKLLPNVALRCKFIMS